MWYVDTEGCNLQGDVRKKVKTPGAGKNMVGEAVQTPLYPSLGFMHGLQQSLLLKKKNKVVFINICWRGLGAKFKFLELSLGVWS
jgi:hypothetical protein